MRRLLPLTRRHLSTGQRKPPPPPPPRREMPLHKPNSRSEIPKQVGSKANAKRGEKSGGGKVLGALALGLSGYALYSYYASKEDGGFREYESSEDNTVGKLANKLKDVVGRSAPAKDKESDTNVSRAFLESLAKKGDAEAAKVLKVVEEEKVEEEERKFLEDGLEADFRLDVSKDGLLQTLNSMLSAKRMEENMIYQMYNARGYAAHPPKKELDEIREDKRQIKLHIKAIKRSKV